jgi:hypothetical protein
VVAAAVTALAAIWVARDLLVVLPLIRSALHDDFTNYYFGARRMMSGLSPFEVVNLNQSPLVPFLTLVVAWLPYPEARLLWFVLSEAALALSGYLTWRFCGRDRTAGWIVAVVWVAGGSVAETLYYGQLHPFILLLACCGILGLRRGTPGSAAAAGVATAIKFFPAPMLLTFAWQRRVRQLVIAVAAALIGVALPQAAIRLLCPPPYAPVTAGYWTGSPSLLNVSAPATVLRAADWCENPDEIPPSWVVGNDPARLRLPPSRRLLSVLTGAVVLGLVLAWLAWATGLRPVADPEIVAATLLSAAVLASPISWHHYYVLHFPAIACLLVRWARRGERGLLVAGGAGFCLAPWLFNTGVAMNIEDTGWILAEPVRFWALSLVIPVAVAVLLALCCMEIRRETLRAG